MRELSCGRRSAPPRRRRRGHAPREPRPAVPSRPCSSTAHFARGAGAVLREVHRPGGTAGASASQTGRLQSARGAARRGRTFARSTALRRHRQRDRRRGSARALKALERDGARGANHRRRHADHGEMLLRPRLRSATAITPSATRRSTCRLVYDPCVKQGRRETKIVREVKRTAPTLRARGRRSRRIHGAGRSRRARGESLGAEVSRTRESEFGPRRTSRPFRPIHGRPYPGIIGADRDRPVRHNAEIVPQEGRCSRRRHGAPPHGARRAVEARLRAHAHRREAGCSSTRENDPAELTDVAAANPQRGHAPQGRSGSGRSRIRLMEQKNGYRAEGDQVSWALPSAWWCRASSRWASRLPVPRRGARRRRGAAPRRPVEDAGRNRHRRGRPLRRVDWGPRPGDYEVAICSSK